MVTLPESSRRYSTSSSAPCRAQNHLSSPGNACRGLPRGTCLHLLLDLVDEALPLATGLGIELVFFEHARHAVAVRVRAILSAEDSVARGEVSCERLQAGRAARASVLIELALDQHAPEAVAVNGPEAQQRLG